MRESPDAIYNGPRHTTPLKTGSLGGAASYTEQAFALGRQKFREGFKPGQFCNGRSKAWIAEFRRGYALQKRLSERDEPQAASGVMRIESIRNGVAKTTSLSGTNDAAYREVNPRFVRIGDEVPERAWTFETEGEAFQTLEEMYFSP
jgi:hypothetical protein